MANTAENVNIWVKFVCGEKSDMKIDIVTTKLDKDRLNKALYEFSVLRDCIPYIFMNNLTAQALGRSTDIFSEIAYPNDSAHLRNKCGYMTRYNDCKVYENSDLRFGEIELR